MPGVELGLVPRTTDGIVRDFEAGALLTGLGLAPLEGDGLEDGEGRVLASNLLG